MYCAGQKGIDLGYWARFRTELGVLCIAGGVLEFLTSVTHLDNLIEYGSVGTIDLYNLKAVR